MTDLKAIRVRCEYATNPLGIDVAQPRLSWQLAALRANARGAAQSAYQVLVASSEKGLSANRGDVWDSGKVASAQSIQVAYAGRPLRAGQRVYWKVRVWDGRDRPSRYSAPGWWEMGLLSAANWRAQWIGRAEAALADDEDFYRAHPAPLLRKAFRLDKPIRRARAYVTGLGYYELYLNGEKVGDHLLDPGWTDFSKRVYYSTFDVTELLNNGDNAVGFMLGNGWYNPLPMSFWGHINIRSALNIGEPKALLQLVVDYADGTREAVITDETWKADAGPIVKNNIYLGEVYDARLEQPGWSRAGFDDSHWQAAKPATPPGGALIAQDIPPIRATRIVQPVAVTEPAPGVYIFDLGRNFAGWVRLRCRGEVGTRVVLRYGELLYPDGTLNPMTSVAGQIKHCEIPPGSEQPVTAWQSDTYILKGEGEETYTPRFTWHGFRYVELTGYPGKPGLEALEGLVLHADVTPVGTFSCSNSLFNRIQEMTLWTELSNLFSVQSDCPHRERFGYGGDIVASSEMAMLNFDMAQFYGKAVRDLADAARPNGGFTETAPFVGISDAGLGELSGPVGWGAAHPLLLWQLYQYYGDLRILEEQYPAVCRWMKLLGEKAPELILDNGISDHESLVPKNPALTGTAFYYYNATLASRIASAIARPDDAARYAELAERTRAAFNARFLNHDTGQYGEGTQASQAFALYLDLVPEEQRTAALDALARDIVEGHQGHLTTGIFGTKYMLEALSRLGCTDAAYMVVNQKTFPGWGYMLENGATTLWEHWEFSDDTYSHNHPMFGSVSEWFYKALAGIAPAPDAVGFDEIVIRPGVAGKLKWVKASYQSVRGLVASEWRRRGRRLSLTVSVPPNSRALVYVPTSSPESVKVGQVAAESVSGVTLMRQEAGASVYRVASGRYRFSADWAPAPAER